jgi:hypothetical protein
MGSKTAMMGGYGGFVVLEGSYAGSGHKHPFDLNYFHGAGGGGPVTKDTIRANRMAASALADIYWCGHVHEHWSLWTSRTIRRKKMAIEQRTELHIRTPGYHDDYGDGYSGFSVETGKPAKVCGSYWLKVYKKQQRLKALAFDINRAA